jgi:hypothetical protein
MFDTFQTNRLNRERELWIRQMKMGKKRYLFMHAMIFGGAIFTLLRGVIYFFTLYVHPFNSTGKLVVAAVGMFVSLWVGYRIGLLFWRRGVRITSATGTTE